MTAPPEHPGAFGEQALREAAERALQETEGDEAEALVLGQTQALTRFANNAVHQNVAAAGADLRIRVVAGKRVAAVWTNRLDPDGIRAAARQAGTLVRLAPENPQWAGLPAAGAAPHAPAFREATAAASPERRARLAATICGPSRVAGLRAAGFVSTTVNEVAVANSHGTWAYHAGTVAEAQAVALGEAGSGYADRVHADLDRLDVGAVAAEAIHTAQRAQRPREVPAGTYEVVLEPYAVADVVEFLGSQLTGLAVEEGRSFVGGRLGERVTGETVTLVEDPVDPEGLPRPFDFEGVPSERLVLIERGHARSIVYDSQTAARNGARNTGHALPTGPAAPLPMHLRLEPGTKTREALIAGVKRGILVSRFWYTRWVHPLRTIVTGMTRDGTFLIENGEVASPVQNFRFTQSYHEALAGVVAMEHVLKLQRLDLWDFEAGSIRVPAVHLAAFTFTGTTHY
ncbi:MAG TPA: TldD/PmbA family protein [Methylomirabilota bacterium]|nr:TldD/PmbA family protein [Methylomirabilota bacterium]